MSDRDIMKCGHDKSDLVETGVEQHDILPVHFVECKSCKLVHEATVVALEAACKAMCPFCDGAAGRAGEGVEQVPQATASGNFVHCLSGTMAPGALCGAAQIRALITNDAALVAARAELVRKAVENERKKWTMLYHEPSGAVLDFGAIIAKSVREAVEKACRAMCWRCRNGDPLGPHGVSHKYDEYSFAECDAKPIREAFMVDVK